jgi:hypothetical protein
VGLSTTKGHPPLPLPHGRIPAADAYTFNLLMRCPRGSRRRRGTRYPYRMGVSLRYHSLTPPHERSFGLEGLESRHLESRAKAAARLGLEVSAGLGEPILSRGLRGGDALQASTGAAGTRTRGDGTHAERANAADESLRSLDFGREAVNGSHH